MIVCEARLTFVGCRWVGLMLGGLVLGGYTIRYCQSSKVLCMDRNAIGLQSSPIGRPIGLLGSDRIAQNSKPTPVWAANIRHKASDLCSAATLGMTMPCLVSEWSRTSGLLRVACN